MLLISNGTILTRTELGVISQGHVLVEGDRIVKVGNGPWPEAFQPGQDDQVVDATGLFVSPGLIDAHNHVGLFDDSLAMEGSDGNEMTDPVTPHMRAIDGIYHADRCFQEALAHGVTAVMTGPGSANVIGGQFALMSTAGESTDEMALIPVAAMKAAFGENPKRVYGREKKSPATRMATAAILREALFKATEYRKKKKGTDSDKNGFDMKWEAMLPVLDGTLPLKIHAHRADDILTAVRVANEFGLTYTLDHCTEGYLIADQLKRVYEEGLTPDCGIGQTGRGRLKGIIAGPLISDRSKPELQNADLENPVVLSRTGIPLALMTDHPVNPIQYLPVAVAMAVRAGMPEEAALASITDSAALLCGAGDILGRLKEGYQADMVLFDGHPLDTRTRAKQVFVKGRTVFARDPSANRP